MISILTYLIYLSPLSLSGGYMLVTYYSMLLSWVANAFFSSFKDNFWSQDVTGSEAKEYFYDNIIVSTAGEHCNLLMCFWMS